MIAGLSGFVYGVAKGAVTTTLAQGAGAFVAQMLHNRDQQGLAPRGLLALGGAIAAGGSLMLFGPGAALGAKVAAVAAGAFATAVISHCGENRDITSAGTWGALLGTAVVLGAETGSTTLGAPLGVLTATVTAYWFNR